jgi:hypothetical protein
MTLTHMGGMDIEELEKKHVANVPFEALTGLKAFVVANALSDIGAPREIISPLVQHLPKLWELFHHYGMTTLELNPIRMMRSQSRRSPFRSPGPGEVLVKIMASGVCHTDLHAADGDWPVKPKLPFIPGHEGTGIVAALGADVTSQKEGDPVGIAWLHDACGCRAQNPYPGEIMQRNRRCDGVHPEPASQ